jgi:hypothetical protein
MKKTLPLVALLVALAGCKEEPPRKPLPSRSEQRSGEERRSHALRAPGPVGTVEGTRFYVDLQADRPEALTKRPVLVETDARNRTIGHAYLSTTPNKGFVDLDIVVVASNDTVYCYDNARHELRWEMNYADRGYDVDELVRRGGKLDVIFAGKLTETLSLATGQKTIP